jgi:site-specific DNA-methyltransferase (adenine-specific)
LRDYGVDGQIGLESTPDAYVAELVAVFREVRRVLADDGVLWLNLGDSYRNKQRIMIPARVALALQADEWWLRDEIVWHKPRTTPAPLKDRSVPAHEMLYLLAKSETYFFDWEAIEVPSAFPGLVRKARSAFRGRSENAREFIVRDTRRIRSVWSINPPPNDGIDTAIMPHEMAETCIKAGSRPGDTILDPFGGAGTTGLVADHLNRNSVLIELNPEYRDLAANRVTDDSPLFADVSAA